MAGCAPPDVVLVGALVIAALAAVLASRLS